MRTRISSKGQIVIPAELRQRDGIDTGQEVEFERLDRGEYRLTRVAAPPNEGAVDWLLSCPEKGYFTPVSSRSTNSL
jgi:AbrB family looped-hinge helix DNA binding protein